MHSDYKTILERKLNTDTQVDTYKGLFTQPFNAIFSFECSVSEIDSFLCQQGFQSIHGLWMCMGRCGCVYATVCIMFVFHSFHASDTYTIVHSQATPGFYLTLVPVFWRGDNFTRKHIACQQSLEWHSCCYLIRKQPCQTNVVYSIVFWMKTMALNERYSQHHVSLPQ